MRSGRARNRALVENVGRVFLSPGAKAAGLSEISRLMEVAIGNGPASLWVLEGNERAQAFYRRKGFVADGTVADEPFFDVTELRMVRRGA